MPHGVHPTSIQLEESWKAQLHAEFAKPYFQQLVGFLKAEKAAGKTIYPPGGAIFRAFELTPFDQVKVVILGQDPYHGPGQAEGLCFSVQPGVPLPPSLRNIYQEMADDLGLQPPATGSLVAWAQQGVLLLNATLTVEARKAGSHQNKGWEQFTDAAVQALSTGRQGLVFLLWGRYAQQKGALVDADRHQVLAAAHPSPFAAHKGFFGCRHFSKANAYLQQQGLPPIQWA